ncbi:glycine betaine ABC transporter substrate-binding protein [Arthrobacter crusticola]|uniref:Glycine betaine ABC transporter substrate-binding protein n=1 Tax=Arthrobacter crusticola TaxID=2547960 RepID=A0A4R5TZN9_9MICC|nr:glycine betaine ABC transporter substrate-binding protein [Arthrobacter crusticola]TDK26716.1 glycine betaine ABC transporter substrate-binding protein [Arthrobacter crusticola]
MTPQNLPAPAGPRGTLPAVLAASAALLAGCGLQPATSYVPEAGPGSIEVIEGAEGTELTVTSKNFTEQLILGKISVLAAAAAGFDVTDLTNVPGSQPVRELLVSGDADLTIEYTGTAWLTFLNQSKGIPDKEKQWQAVHDADLANSLTWGRPAPLNNTYAIAVRTEAVEELGGITKLSQIAALPVEERTFCVESEFNSRSDGLNPMLKHYGLTRGTPDGVPDGNIGVYDTGAVYSATDKGNCNFGEVFSTDGRIDALELTLLEDDLNFFPAYNAAPVFGTAVLEEHPGLEEVFAQVAAELTDEELRRMNLLVDVEGQEPADVAFDFMVDKGFISEAGEG